MCWGCAGGLCHFFVFSLICQRHIKKEVAEAHLKRPSAAGLPVLGCGCHMTTDPQSGWLLPGLESLASGAQQHSSAVRICRACCSRHLPRAVRLQFTN